jgi:hypothetical protein
LVAYVCVILSVAKLQQAVSRWVAGSQKKQRFINGHSTVWSNLSVLPFETCEISVFIASVEKVLMMKRFLFYFALFALIASEAYRMYLLSPMPGSQHSEMTDVSYFLWNYRWFIRMGLTVLLLIGLRTAFERRKWIPVLSILFAGAVFYMVNFKMSADHMFYEPEKLEFTHADSSGLEDEALVLSVSSGGETHAYPIRYLAYHHKIHDVIGGQNVMISYCNVCRSALAFDPTIDGVTETFRLVGMDQFNAMIEDNSTGSWWQQATGECIAGERKGQQLFILDAQQMSVAEWKKMYPNGKIMRPDLAHFEEYGDEKFEQGTSTSTLVGTDTTSWGEKSWVIGVERNGNYRAYDWRTLVRERIIRDTLGGENLMVTIDAENINYEVVVYSEESPTKIDGTDTVENIGYHPGTIVIPIAARQMFWHTWRTFYPATTKYPG